MLNSRAILDFALGKWQKDFVRVCISKNRSGWLCGRIAERRVRNRASALEKVDLGRSGNQIESGRCLV